MRHVLAQINLFWSLLRSLPTGYRPADSPAEGVTRNLEDPALPSHVSKLVQRTSGVYRHLYTYIYIYI